MKYPWQNILYIDPLGKTIPYQPPQALQQTNKGGTGFINLKTQVDAIEHISDIQDNDNIKASLAAINSPDTGVFTVGCHAEKIIDKDSHQASGYLEFAVNDQALACEAATYFALYLQFHNRLALSKFEHAVKFEWAIMPAVFTAISLQGFTCSIKINTALYPKHEQCDQVWSDTLVLITSHLVDIEPGQGKAIY